MASSKKGTVDSDEDQKKILSALAGMSNPASGKEIAQKAGLDEKTASNLIKKLKTSGFIDSPVRCKYAITEAGRTALGK